MFLSNNYVISLSPHPIRKGRVSLLVAWLTGSICQRCLCVDNSDQLPWQIPLHPPRQAPPPTGTCMQISWNPSPSAFPDSCRYPRVRNLSRSWDVLHPAWGQELHISASKALQWEDRIPQGETAQSFQPEKNQSSHFRFLGDNGFHVYDLM